MSTGMSVTDPQGLCPRALDHFDHCGIVGTEAELLRSRPGCAFASLTVLYWLSDSFDPQRLGTHEFLDYSIGVHLTFHEVAKLLNPLKRFFGSQGMQYFTYLAWPHVSVLGLHVLNDVIKGVPRH